MNEENISASQNSSSQDTNYSLSSKLTVGIFVVLLLVFIGLISFSFIKGKLSSQPNSNKNSLDASTSQITPVQALTVSPTVAAQVANTISPTTATNIPSAASSKACARTGNAQKWEYLTSYTVKENDTLQSIATAQLNDPARVNEIIQLNGVGPYVVGTTLYLPPPSITKSSGNLKEVFGKLVDKNTSFWHISFSTDSNGLGILIPAFWFNSIPNSNSFSVGDCITVLYDDGYKVYSVALQ